MTHPEDQTPGSSAEEDPTGIHDLLSSLPDPGPMPEFLSRRISDSLAHEAAVRSGRVAPSPSPPHEGGRGPFPVPPSPQVSGPQTPPDVIPFARPTTSGSRRRSVMPWLAGAAAITIGAAGGITAYQLAGQDDGLTAAVQPNQEEPGSSDGVADEAPGGNAAPAPFVDIKVGDSGEAYASADLPDQLNSFLVPAPSLSWDQDGAPSTDSAWSCATGLPDVDPTQVEQVRADRVTLDAEPALLVGVYSIDGQWRVWAVDPSCTSVLQGPITPEE